MADKTIAPDENIVVIGLGRFGGQVAESLLQLGHEVLGVDEDAEIVQQWSDQLTHVVQADSTDSDALLQVGAKEFTRAVVGIGNNIEASVLTVLTLSELGLRDIWAKAVSAKHGRILRSVGAHHVIYPEATMGDRVAHLIADRMLDVIEFDDGFAVARTKAPPGSAGRTLADLGLRSKYGLTVIGVKTPGADLTYAVPETVVPGDAELVVGGSVEQVRRFTATT
ncbi:TrkA family potassium uptake protein [Actinoplanes sp. NPDC049596]|uniref:potassium channel family protein n=1 Tax=unclassified Actinoplanes TaxID=2626549 RepID=UPI00343E970B